ncbi:LysR family transcriptional regulator [Mumia zhuanghuii]|uniref:LysR family transcriptional regulator n=2 Tax=Mumia TaxID=1546255 RepID=A0ABW1QSU3_9ACTN|nr:MULTISPECIES: LysR family transcriptional regulator [Mumia]KAA1423879.1 LysR family transcriptional regulator [Mumia zhuanghuii]
MRLEQLAYVTAVTEHGSLRRAGENLHISQPALSEAISKLERELGTVLLDRHRSGARVSDTGRDLLPHISDVLAAVDRLRAAARGQGDARRPMRIGSVNTGAATVVLPALRTYQLQDPGVPFELRQLQQDEIHLGLSEGTLDVGLVNLLPGDDVPPDLLGVELIKGRPAAVLPVEHPLAARPRVTVDELRREPFVGARQGFLMHRVAHRLFGEELPVQWHTCDGADIGKHMVATGLGLSLMPDFTIEADPLVAAGLIAARPLADATPAIRMVLLLRRGSRPSDAVRRLVDHLRHQAERVTVRSD